VLTRLLRDRVPPEPIAPSETGPAPWPPLTEPAPVQVAPGPQTAWVEPNDGICPPSHPVKAKLSSKIFHVEGGANYARTNPDRCYRDTAAAEADGLRPAKR
jgi:hypothetical protein